MGRAILDFVCKNLTKITIGTLVRKKVESLQKLYGFFFEVGGGVVSGIRHFTVGEIGMGEGWTVLYLRWKCC